MQEGKALSFSLCGIYHANPHLYDYIHQLEFSASDEVEMLDGAAQLLNARVKGRFVVQARDQNSIMVHFSNLAELKQKPQFLVVDQNNNPVLTPSSKNRSEDLTVIEHPDYRNDESIRVLAPVSVLVTREEGIFPFARQVVWKVNSQAEWPCLLYQVRYVFEVDPLVQVHDRREGRYYYRDEAAEPDTRYYYRQDDAQKLTAEALSQMGISL